MTRPSHGMVLTFLGGTGTVTGSRFLVESATHTVLVDCGLFQGLKELRLRNWEPFPVDPSSIDTILVTHAHIDHLGYLPRLVKLGFSGRVVCTRRTAALAAIVLPDSGHLQEEEAAFANRMGYSKHTPALPLYTEDDARASLARFDPVDFDTPVALGPGLEATFRPAGHILGSATIRLADADSGRSLLFSGDLGRPHHPLLVAPSPPDGADVVVMESTYGGRSHHDGDPLVALADAVVRTAARGGTVVIPAFAVDRTEVLLHALRRLTIEGAIPALPVYVDSPMALRALRVYRQAIAEADADLRPDLDPATDWFDTGQLHEVPDVEGSKALAGLPHPAVIISASGMATGGRVLHHLARLLPHPRNTVVLAGFQAAGTRGRLLADGHREVKMLGAYVPVRADVVDLRGFSVHADHDELVDWVAGATRPPDTVFLVHGEPEGSDALRDAIVDRLGWPCVVPRHLERVRIDRRARTANTPFPP